MADAWSSVGGLFPSEDEIGGLIVGPHSVTWQFTSDVRLFFDPSNPIYAALTQLAPDPIARLELMELSELRPRDREEFIASTKTSSKPSKSLSRQPKPAPSAARPEILRNTHPKRWKFRPRH